MKSKNEKKEHLDTLRLSYNEHLQYASDNQSLYEQAKQGKANDDTLRDRIAKREGQISEIEKRGKDFNDALKEAAKTLHTNFLPRLADVLRNEVEQVLNERRERAKNEQRVVDEAQLQTIVEEVWQHLCEKQVPLQGIEKSDLVNYIVSLHSDEQAHGEEHFSHLSVADVERLKDLKGGGHPNTFAPLDEQRESIVLDLRRLPEMHRLLDEDRRALAGNDYDIITTYEDNDRRCLSEKQEIEQLQKEIADIEKEIGTIDIEQPRVPDPQYEMLKQLPDFFANLSNALLANKRKRIEEMMKEQLNINLVSHSGVIGRVSLDGDATHPINFRIFHTKGNEIHLTQLNAGAKQTVMQVLLKVLYELGDYQPPVMIDTVMGVLDKESRAAIIEHYFPDLAHQTILLSTDSEITLPTDFEHLKAFVSKVYTLHRHKEEQCSSISNDYFGTTL